MYEVVLRKKAHKKLKRLESKHKKRILIALVKLRKDPLLGKALVGKLKGYYSLRVWPFRIIYKIYKSQLVVFVIDIGHRQGVYK
ncbi:type II toxin-antitoxin system RelE/ParE family toxin [Patescibacteria group bacterium]